MAKKKTKRKKAIAAVKQAMTKSMVISQISESTGLTKKEVRSVFDELGVVIERHVKKNAVGHFTLPGLLKIKTVKKPARKAQKNVPNPFRPGEFMDMFGWYSPYLASSVGRHFGKAAIVAGYMLNCEYAYIDGRRQQGSATAQVP